MGKQYHKYKQINSRIMEIWLKTGKNIHNISILNTYAPDTNQPQEKENTGIQ